MFYTTEKLYEATGCKTPDGLRMWLTDAGIPFSVNGAGKPQVREQFAHMVPKASNAIEAALGGVQTLKRRDSAVYLLKNRGKVVYVGMSLALLSRLGKHCTSAFVFDEIDVVPISKKYVSWLETELIARHMPKYNKAKKPVPQKQFENPCSL